MQKASGLPNLFLAKPVFPVRVEGGAPCARGAEQCDPVPGSLAPCAVCQPGIVMQALLQKQRG